MRSREGQGAVSGCVLAIAIDSFIWPWHRFRAPAEALRSHRYGMENAASLISFANDPNGLEK